MKKMLAFMLAATMVLTMTVNVFAVTTVQGNLFTRETTGNPLLATSGVNDDNTNWEFKSSTGFYYTVIPDNIKTGADGKKQYMLVSNTYYGKLPDYENLSKEKFLFDPDAEDSIAHWLNNEFLNGTAAESHGDCTGASLDTSVKEYLVENDWYVEGIGSDALGEEYQYDFYANCKVALLSTKDFVNYGKYMKKSLKFANGNAVPSKADYSCILRTPGALEGTKEASYVKRYVQSSGNTGGCAVSYCGIRPCFYVTEDYFKEQNLTECGTYVQQIVDSFDTGVTVLTEDAQDISELSVDEWYFSGTNAVASDVSTVSDGVIAITEGKWIGRKLPSSINSGIICVETDVNYTQANGYLDLCMGFTFENSATSPSYKYPLYFTKGSTLAKYRFKASASSSSASYKQFENIYYDIGFDGATTAHLKFVVDLDTGYHYISIDGKNSGILKDLSYITDNVMNGTDAIDKIVFYNPNGNATGYTLDNIKITHDENGSVIDTIEVTGEKEITITSKDYASFASVSASDISITDCSVANIAANNNVLTVTTEEKLSEDKTYYAIVDGITRSDIPDYNIIGNFDSFEVNKFAFTNPVIDAKFASGEVVKATMTVTKGDVDSKDVTLVIAAYNGDRLIGMNSDAFDADTDTQKNLEASFTLKENATELRAFVWDENRFPLCAFVPALNN